MNEKNIKQILQLYKSNKVDITDMNKLNAMWYESIDIIEAQNRFVEES